MENKHICDCDCHIKGHYVMHMMDCCDHTYEHYINEDGTIDKEAYDKLLNPRYFLIISNGYDGSADVYYTKDMTLYSELTNGEGTLIKIESIIQCNNQSLSKEPTGIPEITRENYSKYL